MHPQYRRPLHQRNGVEHRCAVERCCGVSAYQLEDHTLARHAHEHRQFKGKQTFSLRQDSIVFVERLAEAIAGVEDNVLGAIVAQRLHLFGKGFEHVVHVALHRHEDVRHLQLAHRLEHVALLVDGRVYDARDAALRHIVDDVSAKLLNAAARHQRAVGVYGDRGIGLFTAHDGDGTFQTFRLLLLAHLHGTWTCRERPHVNKGATFIHDLVGTVSNLTLSLFTAATVERVGCGVKNAHHLGR